MKITIVDYGMGNIKSVKNAINSISDIGIDVEISSKPETIAIAENIILPGVGYFSDAMNNLHQKGLVDALNESAIKRKIPIFAICLGMQLLFEESEEGGGTKGLGWLPGKVRKIPYIKPYRVPHMGWNDVEFKNESKVFSGLGKSSVFYFVHSYHCVCDSSFVTATCNYGSEFNVAVEKDNIIAMQFHPEKSHHNGLDVLKNYINILNKEPHHFKNKVDSLHTT